MAEYPYKQYLKDERGKYIKVYASTPEELAEKVRARQAEIDHLIALQHNPTVSMYAVTWMKLQPSDLSESRLSDFDLSLRLHILPHIGNMHMLDVTADHIAELMKAESRMSRSMQQKIVFVLKGMFALAVSEGLVANNPCATLKAGGKTSSKKDSLTMEQRQKLIEAVRGTRAYTFVMVGLYAGLRTEEALALQWDAVTLDGDTPCLDVRRKLLWEKGKKEPVIYDDLKTDAAWRIVTIPDVLVECLRAEKATGASDFVIHDTKGQPCTEAAFRAIWSLVERRQLEEYRPKKRRSQAKNRDADGRKPDRRGFHKGCPHTLDFAVTPHTLRRSYATELILGGADLATAQYLLGHKKGETTLNWYVKIMQGRPADTIKKVRAAFDTQPGDGASLPAKSG